MKAQHGAAALVVVTILLFAMALGALYTNRNLLLEQRTSANQYRSTLAFEAAEAGVEWALAQLNANRRIGADCLPTMDAAATSFRSRYLTIATGDGGITPSASAASCARTGHGWDCSCPVSGAPTLSSTTGAAFTLRFVAANRPGLVRIVSTGCTRFAGECVAGSSTRADATATVEATLGIVGGLRTAPAATVTTRGAFDAGNAAIGLHNVDPATGLAVDAGAAIVATQARTTGPAGAPADALLLDHDSSLAALDADRFFASYFGLDKASWQAQAAVERIVCPSDCGAALTAAIRAAPDAALIQVDGDLTVSGALTLGTPQRPVAIVVGGHAQLVGPIAMHGLLYAASLRWDQVANGSGAIARGALVSEAGYLGHGAPDLVYDAAILATLTHGAGSFVRVHGSWRDF